MRILLTSHFPPWRFGSGLMLRELARGLIGLGHEVRCLCTADRRPKHSEDGLRVIVCSLTDAEAELPFELPEFYERTGGCTTFANLSDAQLNQYRETFRRQLDIEVSEFNPQIIHGQHAGLQSELILETGVPYVLSVHESELRAWHADSRIEPLALQGVENAGRVFITRDSLRKPLLRYASDINERLVKVMPLIEMPLVESSDDERRLQPRTEESKPATERPPTRLTYFADFSPEWGVETLLNALGRLHEEMTTGTLHATIYGSAPTIDWARILIRQRQLERVFCVDTSTPEFHEFESEQASGDEASIVVISDTDEVCETIALRALYAGSAVIGQGEFPIDWAAGEKFAQVPAADHELLAQKIEEIIEGRRDGTLRQSLAGAEWPAWRRENHRTSTFIQQLYETVLRERFGST